MSCRGCTHCIPTFRASARPCGLTSAPGSHPDLQAEAASENSSVSQFVRVPNPYEHIMNEEYLTASQISCYGKCDQVPYNRCQPLFLSLVQIS